MSCPPPTHLREPYLDVVPTQPASLPPTLGLWADKAHSRFRALMLAIFSPPPSLSVSPQIP